MDFRRSQLDDRRRRVLMEEVASPLDDEQAAPTSAGKRAPLRAYGEPVLTDRQLRISDLIPLRPLVITLLVLTMLTGVAAIETLYICCETSPLLNRAVRTLAFDRAQLAPINLAARGNLAAWYSSLLLTVGAAGSLIIFAIRCHRVDDYRGRYRLWLWTCAGLLWASLDAATGIHALVGASLAWLSGSKELAVLGWLAIYLLVFGALSVRLAIETWHSVGSFSALSIAAVLYLLAGMTALGWLTFPGYLLATVLETSLEMIAHVTLLTGLLLYARHVHLDAQGKLPLRLRTQGPKPKRKSRPKLAVVSSDAKEEGGERKAAAKSTTQPAAASKVPSTAPAASSRPGPLAAKVAASVSHDDDDDDASDAGDDGDEQLSKSERRRLKKLMRQQRRAA
ncbi:MAG TPA: hypothetical protein VMP01_23220 [Pirellulaceae bacterium]|nr:hypothetical protein [Pirellulaceae bacterium]